MTSSIDTAARRDAVARAADELLPAYTPRWPSTQMLGSAAALFVPLDSWDGHEGPRARIEIAPGCIGVRRRDLARRERTYERATVARRRAADHAARRLRATGKLPERPSSQRRVTGWSRKSRANMVKALCQLDYGRFFHAGGQPGMVTLTYPGDWLTVAPDGPTCKRHLFAFRRAFERAWGLFAAIWKLEFQRRGAPHYHILMMIPPGRARAGIGAGLPFRAWLSYVWSLIVGHPDDEERARHRRAGTNVDLAEGLRARDPKRVAAYFTKHGAASAKEYQHIVPVAWWGPGDGPGRFWGYWRLRRHVVGVELHDPEAIAAARTIRRWSRAQHVTRQATVPRTPGGVWRPATFDVIGLAGAVAVKTQPYSRTRKVRRRVQRLGRGAGWVSVNDGAAYASQLARWLDMLREWTGPPEPRPVRHPPPTTADRAREALTCLGCGLPLDPALETRRLHIGC